MSHEEVRLAGELLLEQADALRLSYPDMLDMAGVSIHRAIDVTDDLSQAMSHLRDEMLVVQRGEATSLGVLNDEAALVRRCLLR